MEKKALRDPLALPLVAYSAEGRRREVTQVPVRLCEALSGMGLRRVCALSLVGAGEGRPQRRGGFSWARVWSMPSDPEWKHSESV